MSKIPSQSATSLWHEWEIETLPPLASHVDTDVCVIGAGIGGVTSAYLLAKEGRSVTLLDAADVARGETGNTTAHLASAIDEHFTELEQLFGTKGARLAAESHAAAIDTIEKICQEEQIDCQFERLDAYLFTPEASPSATHYIDKEWSASRRAGLIESEKLDAAPLLGEPTGPAIRYRHQAQFNPMLYVQGVLKAFLKRGGQFYPQTEVTEVEEGRKPEVFTRQGFRVKCKAVIIASNVPFNDRLVMHTKQAPYRTYVLAFRADGLTIPRALYWDTLDTYHYVRFAEDDEKRPLLIVGGEDHKVGQKDDPENSFQSLEEWARQRFPGLGAVQRRWSGQVLEPVDGLAFIGPNPGSSDNIYIVTGDSGNGMTHGTIAGLLLTDLIQGRENPWAELYEPARKNLHVPSLSTFIKENTNVATQYLDYVTPGDVDSISSIPPGEGAVLRYGLQKVAVYRDSDHQIHCLSAVCPHLAGIVRWNQTEKSWDCPCHGSRFDIYGNVINGPANSELSPFTLPSKQASPARSTTAPL